MNVHCFLLALAVLTISALCGGQEPPANQDIKEPPQPTKKKEELKFKHEMFTFVRVQYTSWGRAKKWATDYPDADQNFTARVALDTGLKTDPNGKVFKLTDPELKKYPFIYLIEPGEMDLTDAEVVALREYLTGGGFLLVDDFWGAAEWANFEEQFQRVFPARPLKDLPLDHPLFHCFYDIKSKPQVPSIHVFARGPGPLGPDSAEPHYRGITDDRGRLLALICHNTDLGDGWEREAVDPNYFREVSQRKAYPLGINIVVYALTR